MILDMARLFLLPALVAFAAASDLFTMTISNRISLMLVAGFFALAALTGMSWDVVLSHIGAGGLVLVIAFACFAFGWVGGGDAKLASAVALWFGFSHLLTFLLYASIFGGILTVVLMQFRQWPLPGVLARQPWLLRLHHQESGIPYGIALAIGALMVYPQTDWCNAVDLTRFAMH